MPSLLDICTNVDKEKAGTNGVASILSIYKKGETAISGWLAEHGWNDLEYVGAGENSLVLRPSHTEDYVVRITLESSRSVLPQVLQPMYTEKFGALKLEILPNIDRNAGDEVKKLLLPAFKQELIASGHDLLTTKPDDFGIFTFGGKKVLMGMDGESVTGMSTAHTANYPPFSVQWEEQCKLVEKHPELQAFFKSIGNPSAMPDPLPDSKEVSIVRRL